MQDPDLAKVLPIDIKHIGRKLGSGNNAHVYSYGENYALKIEASKSDLLQFEYKVYKCLGNCDGVPKVYFFQKVAFLRSNMLMERLGNSLGDFKKPFDLKTVLMVGLQLV